MTEAIQSSWKCFLCWKLNDPLSVQCSCCKRDRSYAARSYIDSTQAKPLALHGLALQKFAFRPEQLAALQQAGLDLSAHDLV